MHDIEVVREALRILDVLEFNGVPGAVVTADAVAALDSLEAELAQVREERDKARAALKYHSRLSVVYREALERIATGDATAYPFRIARAALTGETTDD